jgi:hypothetical protein
LRVLNSGFKKRYFAIIVVWLGFTVLAFAYFSKDRLVTFDIDNKLQGVDHLQFAGYLQDYLPTNKVGVGNQVIHFSKTGCDCQKFSQNHIVDLNKMAKKNQFNIVNVEVNEHDIIPATPSVAILDKFGKVIYFGPYGQGLGCSQTSGFAQTMLNNLVQGFSANILVREAKGCYCHL